VDAFVAVDDNSIIAEKIGYNRGLREKGYAPTGLSQIRTTKGIL
jgi:hypothetical protein